MPTYEYRCRACGHGFDIVQSFKDESLTICPACGGELRKVYGAPAISFKGSGFYATDSRKGSKKESTESRREGSKTDGQKKDGAAKEGSSKDGSSSSSSSEGSSSKPKESSSGGGSSSSKKDPS
jgi:putative FmdB family regulatory protein